METQQKTLEDIVKELVREVVREEINLALERHLPSLAVAQQAITPEIMDIGAAAQYLKLSKPTVYGMVQKMKIPNYKRGKRLYFYKSDLDEYVMRGRRKTMEEIEREAASYIVRSKRRY